MLAGNPLEFAVEVFHEPESPQWTGFGRMCLHIKGIVLGRIDEPHCSLFHAIDQITTLADLLPDLWDDRFVSRTDESIFSFLDAVLYEGTEPYDSSLERFDFLTNTGVQFDDCKTFIYCTPTGSVHVLYQREDEPPRSAACTSHAFATAASALREWWHTTTHSINPPDTAA